MLPQEIFKKEHSETFPAFLETKYQFLKKAGVHSNSLEKVKYLMKMDKW